MAGPFADCPDPTPPGYSPVATSGPGRGQPPGPRPVATSGAGGDNCDTRAGQACARRSCLVDLPATDPCREGIPAMAEPNGTVAVRDPDALLKEIEATRENLARTIDALTERASPASVGR